MLWGQGGALVMKGLAADHPLKDLGRFLRLELQTSHRSPFS